MPEYLSQYVLDPGTTERDYPKYYADLTYSEFQMLLKNVKD